MTIMTWLEFEQKMRVSESHVGSFPIRQEITVLPQIDAKIRILPLKVKIYEENG